MFKLNNLKNNGLIKPKSNQRKKHNNSSTYFQISKHITFYANI